MDGCSLKSWQFILDKVPCYLKSPYLQHSFSLWGQGNAAQNFESQAELCCEDFDFIIKTMQSHHYYDKGWVMAV